MRFKLGLAIGFAAGYWYGSLPEEERKKQLDEALTKVKGNPRLQRVTDTVSRSAAKVTDAVEEKVVGTAERAGDAVASKVPSTSSTPSASSGPSTSTSSTPSTSSVDDDTATLEKLPGTGIG